MALARTASRAAASLGLVVVLIAGATDPARTLQSAVFGGAPGEAIHVVAFCGLTAALGLMHASLSRVTLFACLLAGFVELAQSVVVERTASVGDLLASCLGALLGAGFATAVRDRVRLCRSRMRPRKVSTEMKP